MDEYQLDEPTRMYAETVVKIEKAYRKTVAEARQKANEQIQEALEACRVAIELAEGEQ